MADCEDGMPNEKIATAIPVYVKRISSTFNQLAGEKTA